MLLLDYGAELHCGRNHHMTVVLSTIMVKIMVAILTSGMNAMVMVDAVVLITMVVMKVAMSRH